MSSGVWGKRKKKELIITKKNNTRSRGRRRTVQLRTPVRTVPCQQLRQRSRGSVCGGGSASAAEDRDTRCARSSVVRQTCWTQKLVVGGEKARHGVTPGSPYYYYYYKTLCTRATKKHAGNKIYYWLSHLPPTLTLWISAPGKQSRSGRRRWWPNGFFISLSFPAAAASWEPMGECPTTTTTPPPPPTGRCGTYITLTPLQDLWRGWGAARPPDVPHL